MRSLFLGRICWEICVFWGFLSVISRGIFGNFFKKKSKKKVLLESIWEKIFCMGRSRKFELKDELGGFDNS